MEMEQEEIRSEKRMVNKVHALQLIFQGRNPVGHRICDTNRARRTVVQLVELNVGRRHPESTMTAVAVGLTTTAKVCFFRTLRSSRNAN